MEKISYVNILALATGLGIIIICSTAVYLAQKYLFSKYDEKAPHKMEISSSDNPPSP